MVVAAITNNSKLIIAELVEKFLFFYGIQVRYRVQDKMDHINTT